MKCCFTLASTQLIFLSQLKFWHCLLLPGTLVTLHDRDQLIRRPLSHLLLHHLLVILSEAALLVRIVIDFGLISRVIFSVHSWLCIWKQIQWCDQYVRGVALIRVWYFIQMLRLLWRRLVVLRDGHIDCLRLSECLQIRNRRNRVQLICGGIDTLILQPCVTGLFCVILIFWWFPFYQFDGLGLAFIW